MVTTILFGASEAKLLVYGTVLAVFTLVAIIRGLARLIGSMATPAEPAGNKAGPQDYDSALRDGRA